LAEVAHVVDQASEGLSAAHAAGVVHRDLKPDNVLLAKDGRVVVTDFGIARASVGDGGVKTQGGIVGTPAYMAPEQVEGAGDIDARADLYAFGAMVYELLTGVRAWPGDSPYVVAAARLVSPPPDPRAIIPTIPAKVAEVVLRCLARKREERFASAGEFADAFRSAVIAAEGAELELAATSAHGVALSSPIAMSPRPGLAPSLGLDKTIAVLPFKNGGPPEDAYLADGITDDLIDILSMTRGLKVRPRGAVEPYGGVDGDPRKVGVELGVQVIVLGSVRKTPTSIRVAARLISAADGFQLWAKRFDRPTADLLAVNDEAARAIAEALTVAGPANARVAPDDPEAIDLYLRAQHEYNKFWRPDVVRAVELFDEALKLAPNDPTILAGCARARVRVAFFGGEGAAETLAMAMAAAERAVRGAPDHGEAWVALASARMMAGDAPGAARAVKTALDKASGLAPAHDLLGRILLEVKGPLEGMGHLRTALSINPAHLAPRYELARAHALRREWDEAWRLLDLPAPGQGGDMSRFVFRARLCVWRGETHPALANPPALGPEMGLFADPRGVATLFETRELPESMREMLEAGARSHERGRRRTLFFQVNAEILAFVFEIDGALLAIEEAIASDLIDVVWLDLCPALDVVRKDARFAALRATVAARADRVLEALRT
jgi:serine/threonine-protein kinase